ncbi:MAG: GIY-YIG nuclease family protein [Desulfobulbaceae bacterium]|nr:GIY-YIG nuclease family protein [Desulfobulbaceae bacterium]
MKVSVSADPWYVYMAICKDQTIYTGIAKDLQKRLSEHNNGANGAKYTRSRRPVAIVYQEMQPSRSAATKRELQLKKLTRAKKLQLIQELSKK